MRLRVRPPLDSLALIVHAVGTLLLGTGVARADIQYKMQPIVKLGDRVGGVNTKSSGGLFNIFGLTDRGQLTFSTFVAELTNGVALIQYAGGTFTPIAVAGREGPVGTWPADLVGYAPAGRTNQLGNFAFAVGSWHNGDLLGLGTFLWDAESKKVTPVAREGMPAGSDLNLKSGAATDLGKITRIGAASAGPGLLRGGQGIALNSQGQVALPVQIDGGPFTLVLLTPKAE